MRMLLGYGACLVAAVVGGACAGDAGGTPQCSKQLYDSCRDEHDCTSALCRPFADIDLPVCTMMCTAGDNSTCPKQHGVEVTCGADSLCHPPKANSCSLGL